MTVHRDSYSVVRLLLLLVYYFRAKIVWVCEIMLENFGYFVYNLTKFPICDWAVYLSRVCSASQCPRFSAQHEKKTDREAVLCKVHGQRYQLLKIVNYSKLHRTTMAKLTLEKKEGDRRFQKDGLQGWWVLPVTMVAIF